jgi:hypothetical protein
VDGVRNVTRQVHAIAQSECINPIHDRLIFAPTPDQRQSDVGAAVCYLRKRIYQSMQALLRVEAADTATVIVSAEACLE